MQEVPAGHAAAGVPRLRTATQALVMAAVALRAAGTMFAFITAY